MEEEYKPTTLDGFGNFIKSYDMFGYQIAFNFERKGDSHTTVIGGSTSILLKLFMIVYITVCFKRLIFYERDQTTTSYDSNPLSEYVDYFHSNATIFHVLIKHDGTNLNDKEDLQKYINPYFEVVNTNWYKPANSGRF